MKHELTRRTFGMLTLFAAAGLPRISLAEPTGYTNPHLLIEPDELIPFVSLMEDLRPRYEIEGMVVVDVRPSAEFDTGHIPGARQLDPNAVVASMSPVDGSLLPVDALQSLLGNLGIAADRHVILYDERGGFHAARMFWLLEYLGHRNVALLNGGLAAWRAADGPTTRIAVDHDTAVFHAAPSPRRYASADGVLSRQTDPRHILIDVRPSKRYSEGHIPWAINVPWAANLGEGSRFLSAEALRAHFEEHGVTPDLSVTVHCEVGLASSHSYVALRLLGYPQIKVYHRSWSEWGTDASLPKVTS